MDNEFLALALILLVSVVIVGYNMRDVIIHHDSALTGEQYFQEVMDSRSWRRFLDVTWLSKRNFGILLNLLKTNGDFIDSKKISAGQKLIMFLFFLKAN
jgi:hypothetical protein